MQEPKDIKLYREGTELTDSTTLAEAKAENGDTIAMAFALPGGAAPSHAVLPRSLVLLVLAMEQGSMVPTYILVSLQSKDNLKIWTSLRMMLSQLHRWEPFKRKNLARC